LPHRTALINRPCVARSRQALLHPTPLPTLLKALPTLLKLLSRTARFLLTIPPAIRSGRQQATRPSPGSKTHHSGLHARRIRPNSRPAVLSRYRVPGSFHQLGTLVQYPGGRPSWWNNVVRLWTRPPGISQSVSSCTRETTAKAQGHLGLEPRHWPPQRQGLE
jgi:hypothetical protein